MTDTIIDWPAHLPRPTFTGYTGEFQSATIRTEMTTGPARQRLITQTPLKRFGVRWRMAAWQFAAFEAWMKHYAAYGAAWVRMDLLTGQGMEQHVVQFLGGENIPPYKSRPARSNDKNGGVWWIVDATVEAREAQVMTKNVLDVILLEPPGDLMLAIDALHQVINVTLPALE